jgi:putative tryptophan/tyrosine transport system substrate-binding protein
MPVIGYLASSSPGPSAPNVDAFRQGLGETGYVEGHNVAIEYRWAEGTYDAAFASLAQLHAGALLVGDDPFFGSRVEQFVALASRNAVPAIYWRREFAAAGALITYGPSLRTNYRKAGISPERS